MTSHHTCCKERIQDYMRKIKALEGHNNDGTPQCAMGVVT